MITFALTVVFFSQTRCAPILTYSALNAESSAGAESGAGWTAVAR